MHLHLFRKSALRDCIRVCGSCFSRGNRGRWGSSARKCADFHEQSWIWHDVVCKQPQQLTWAFSLGRNLGVDMKTIISIHVIAYIYNIYIWSRVPCSYPPHGMGPQVAPPSLLFASYWQHFWGPASHLLGFCSISDYQPRIYYQKTYHT